jgi:hypothetical protein
VLIEKCRDLRNIIAWIDDDGFTGLLIAKNRAVALQHAHAKGLVNHIPIVYSGYHPMVYKPFGGILVAARQKVMSGSAIPAHYSACPGT